MLLELTSITGWPTKSSNVPNHNSTQAVAKPMGVIMTVSTKHRSASNYHHGDLRQQLIDVACQQLLESSADQLSLRALARRVGVSQTAPYRHFESKNALFAAIATQGFELMTEDLLPVAARHSDDIVQATVELGLAYIRWSLRHPEKYQLFFDSSLLDPVNHAALTLAGAECFAVLTGTIQRGKDQGLFLDKPVELLAGTLWASVHGLASLLRNQTRRNAEFTDDPADQASRLLLEEQRYVMTLFVSSIQRQG